MKYTHHFKVSTHDSKDSTANYYLEGSSFSDENQKGIKVEQESNLQKGASSFHTIIEYKDLQNYIKGNVQQAPIVIFEITQKSTQEGDNSIARFYLETRFNEDQNEQKFYKADLEIGNMHCEQADPNANLQSTIFIMFQEMHTNNLSANDKISLGELKTVIDNIDYDHA